MVRTTKLPEERKQEITEAALKLFSEKGYENTTIQNIADYLNIATGLCYRYFKSKQEIFLAASELYASKAINNLEQIPSRTSDTLEELYFVINTLIEYSIKHNEFECSYKNEPQISISRLNEITKQIIYKIIPIIERGKKEGIFSCDNIYNTVTFLISGIMAMIHTNIPSKNYKDHINSLIPLIEELCNINLKTNEPNKLKLS